jgi:hypothetical protein
VSLENRMGPATGAIVRITWPRDIFEGQEHIALTKLNFGAGFLPDKLG